MGEKLSMWDALSIIAQRTSFQTEEEGRAVLAAIEHHRDDDEQADTTELVDQHEEETREQRRERLRAELAELDDDDQADAPEAKSDKPVPEAKFNIGRERNATDAPRKATPAAKRTTASKTR